MENSYKSKDIAIRIKEFLKLRNKKQSEMYISLGISDRTLDNYKKSMPKADNLALIADYLECSVDYLLGRTDNPYVSVEAYIGGDNNGVQAVKNGTVTINQNTEKQNEMEVELLKAFRTMNFKDKMEIMNIVLAKMKK